MLQEVIDLQNRAVEDLLSLTRENKVNPITFKAPTGSGKTFMMAKFMNEILKERDDVIFLVSTLSKGNLAEQNYEKFKEYQETGMFTHLKPFNISSESSNEADPYIDENNNVYVLARNKLTKTSILEKTKALEKFLISMTSNFNYIGNEVVSGNAKSIYLIKDECHQATNNLDKYKKYFAKTINFSATPNKKQIPNIIISTAEAVNAKLIKQVVKGNANDDLIKAIEKYKDIKDEYIEKLGVNPCLIVQISNEEKGEKEIKMIKDTVERAGLKWMYIAGKTSGKDKDGNDMSLSDTNDDIKKKNLPKEKWRDYAKNNWSTIEVIIFKMTISEGWDIPRACMLYQIRDTKSKQLDEQVIGRVRRNPCLLNFEKLDDDAKELAMTAYVWADIKEDDTISNVEIKNYSNVKNELSIKTTRLKKLDIKDDFDLDGIINNRVNEINVNSIFTMYKSLNRHNQDIIALCDNYTKEYEDWYHFNNNLSEISKKYNTYICDYDKNMVLTTDEKGSDALVTLPRNSTYVRVKENPMGIKDWIWKNIDDNTDFSFDSEAERKWAEVLKDLSATTCDVGYTIGKDRVIKKTLPMLEDFEYLWGKNYLQNSEIKYEYYLDGRHFSYPDFIMKDCYDNIHIFEVKSLNKSNLHTNIDKEEYTKKLNALRACYKKASELTGNIFYLPILYKNTWNIRYFKNGIEKDPLTSEQRLKDMIVNNIATI